MNADSVTLQVLELGRGCAVGISGDPSDAEDVTDTEQALGAIRAALKIGQGRNDEANLLRMQQSKVEIYDASDRAVWHRRRIMDDGCFCVAMQLRLTGHWYLRIHYHFSSDVSIVQPVVRLRELALKRYSKAALAKPDRFAQDGYEPKRDCWCIPLVPKRWCHAH